jgi:hypothetical protein
MIANVQDEDVGGYECMAKSTVGETKSRRAKMEYKRSQSKTRPRFTEAPKDQDVPEGGTFVLNCEAAGSPPPVISWSHTEKPVLTTGRLRVSSTGSLEVRNVVRGDEGIYRCTAQNSIGKVATIAEVRIQSKLSNLYMKLLLK